MKTILATVSLICIGFSQAAYASNCAFHTTNYDGRVVAQNLVYEAESKSVIDKRSGIKLEFDRFWNEEKKTNGLKVIVSDLNGNKIIEKTFDDPFVNGEIDSVLLPSGLYLSGTCSSALYSLVDVLSDAEWSRRSQLEAKCMGRKK